MTKSERLKEELELMKFGLGVICQQYLSATDSNTLMDWVKNMAVSAQLILDKREELNALQSCLCGDSSIGRAADR